MKPFIPREKRSKKARQALDRQNRVTWGPLDPVTRRIENKKAYNRKRACKGDDYDPSYAPFCYRLILQQFA